MFERELEIQGIISHEGTLIDASFIECPKQRNKRDENNRIKQGESITEWSDAKRRQKDVDARWTKKNGQSYFGYKHHVAVDMRSKLIVSETVTSTSVHDSRVFGELMTTNTQVMFADSAYTGQAIPEGVRSNVMERAARNHPPTEEQHVMNPLKARIRCRVEHVFGFIENNMNGSTFRGKSLKRARLYGVVTSLTYNICRVGQFKKAKEKQLSKCAHF